MKAIVLISGGLDSALVVKILQAQNIEVVGVNLATPFNNSVTKALEGNLGIRIISIEGGKDYLALVKDPEHGFGKNVNPCIDCHIYMLKKAAGLMKKLSVSFVATGEVLGQRPMSQNRSMLDLIEKKSGLKGLLLRPLSAKLLKETIPEQKNWVSRDKLLAISGRSRAEQFQLAKELKLSGFTQPAGGCLLTDPGFSNRLKDLLKHKGFNLDNINLLKTGRHFRLTPVVKLVVGRSEIENNKLMQLARFNDYVFCSPFTPGPVALGRGRFDKKSVNLACSIVSSHSDNLGKNVQIDYYRNNLLKNKSSANIPPMPKEALVKYRL